MTAELKGLEVSTDPPPEDLQLHQGFLIRDNDGYFSCRQFGYSDKDSLKKDTSTKCHTERKNLSIKDVSFFYKEGHQEDIVVALCQSHETYSAILSNKDADGYYKQFNQ